MERWQPGPVEHLVLAPGGPGSVFANWDDARRALRYRVFKQVPATDPEPVEITSTGTIVQIIITAVNEAGDGALSATASIVVP